jgi:hypothetical protein
MLETNRFPASFGFLDKEDLSSSLYALLLKSGLSQQGGA